MKFPPQKLSLVFILVAIIMLPFLGSYIAWGGLPPGFSLLATTEVSRPGFNLSIFIALSLMFVGIFSFLLFPYNFGFTKIHQRKMYK